MFTLRRSEPQRTFKKMLNGWRMTEGFDIMFVSHPQFEAAVAANETPREVLQELGLSFLIDGHVREPTAASEERRTIFICYSHEDEDIFEYVHRHMQGLLNFAETDNGPEIWTDREILASQNWQTKIEEALRKSFAAILLVSPHFKTSEFIKNEELPRLLEAAEYEGLKVFWLLAREVYVPATIHKYQAALSPDMSLAALLDESSETLNSALTDATTEIREVLGIR